MRFQLVIEQLGYTEHEARVYLAALELKETTIAELALKARMPRTSTQLITQVLRKKGLLSCYLKRKRKVWFAENPQKILGILKEKEAALNAILPKLQSSAALSKMRMRVETYMGRDEIKLILSDILATKQHICAFGNWETFIQFFGNAYVNNFMEMRERHFLKINLLVLPLEKTISSLKSVMHKELKSVKLLSKEMSINTLHFIYGNKVAVLSLDDRQPVGILTENTDNAETIQLMFESLWNQTSRI